MTRSQAALLIAVLLLAAAFAALNPDFATLANLSTLADQTTILAVLAVGSTFAMISRNIDIAPAAVVALASVVVALVLRATQNLPMALLAGLAATLAVYTLHGLLVARLGLDPLIVTLAGWIWARGLAVSLTNATTLPIRHPFVQMLDRRILFGFTPAIGIVVAVYAAAWFALN